VSENDDSHCAGTTKVEVTSHGKERLKRKAFKRPQKTGIEVADVTVLRQTVPGVSGGNREGPIAYHQTQSSVTPLSVW